MPSEIKLKPQKSRNAKLRDRLSIQKPDSSDADLNSEVSKMVNNTPPASSGNHQKQQIDRKANDELVKYMSNLPSYLEKGDNVKEKALSFGVLDWRRLEKWQHNHKNMSYQSSKYSPSSSNTTSFFSTDGSSSRGHSFSPPDQRMHRPTLQSHLNSSPNEGYSEGVKTIVENVGKCQDLKAESINSLKGHRSIFRMYQSLSKSQSEIMRKECKRKEKEPKDISDIETSHDSNECGVASQSDGMKKIQDVKSFSRGSDIPCSSCPLPREDDTAKHVRIKKPSYVDPKIIKLSSELFQPPPCSVKMSATPCKGKKLEEKPSKGMPLNSTVNKSTDGADMRSLSPTRRFSFGLGKIGRTSSSKDSSAKSNLENSSNVKPNNKSRSQTSPLRRLIDPLLKPMAVNSHHPAELSEKDHPSSAVRACKSSNGRVESSTAHSKEKLDLISCKTINADDSNRDERRRSATVQALLQVAVKNGLPLFTFADENNSGVLAATTMRKVGNSTKHDHSWIYTFFNVHEVKKKSGWRNQGGKGKSHGYIPNVIAQMTVSDAQFSNLIERNSEDELGIREFVLFAVDQHKSDPQPNDELAAIVVNFPKETHKSLNKGGQKSEYPSSRDNEEKGSSVGREDLFRTTVILPGGVHGQASKGEPSPLIDRWKLGGLCDCGGWDLGCSIRVLSSRTKLSSRSSSSIAHHNADRFDLFSQGEVLDDRPIFSLSPFKDGIFSVEFSSSISFLQAFSICIAVLNSRKPYKRPQLSKLFDAKSSEETTLAMNDGVKARNQIHVEIPSSYAPYPPLSPVGRA